MIKSIEVEKIKKLVPELGKQTSLVRKAQADLAMRIRALEAERSELLKKPFTHEDLAELMCADIDRLADRYRTSLASRMSEQMQVKNYGVRMVPNVETALSLKGGRGDLDGSYGGLCDVSGHGDNYYGELSQGALMFLCRDQLKAAAREAAEAVDPWPFSDAKPMAESIARIGAIDAEIEALRDQKTELDSLIEHIGVQPTPEPEPVEEPHRPEGRVYAKIRPDGTDPYYREGGARRRTFSVFQASGTPESKAI